MGCDATWVPEGTVRKPLHICSMVALALLLAGCGGGGSSNIAANKAELPVTPTALNVTAQANGSASPIHIAASTSSHYALKSWSIYVDSILAFTQQTSATAIDQPVS